MRNTMIALIALPAVGACATSAEPEGSAYVILKEGITPAFSSGEIDAVRPGPDDSLILVARPNTFYRAKLSGPCLTYFDGPYAPRLDTGPGGAITLSTRVFYEGRECRITRFDRIEDPSKPRP
jgi:hypothetical protein